MKLAVCLYGYPRFSEQGSKFWKHFLDGFDVDFYLHSWFSEDTSEEDTQLQKKLIESQFNPKVFEFEKQISFSRDWSIKIDYSKLGKRFTEPESVLLHTTLSPMWSIYKCGEMLKLIDYKYDFVIFSRTDIFCSNRLQDLIKNADSNTVYSSFCEGDIWDLNKNGNCIDAKMILGNYTNMVYFSELYSYLENYLGDDKIPLCHHRLFAHHLRKIVTKFEMISKEKNSWFYIRNGSMLEGEMGSVSMDNYEVFDL